MILFKKVQLACCKAICVFSKKYNLFMINVVMKYKMK